MMAGRNIEKYGKVGGAPGALHGAHSSFDVHFQ